MYTVTVAKWLCLLLCLANVAVAAPFLFVVTLVEKNICGCLKEHVFLYNVFNTVFVGMIIIIFMIICASYTKVILLIQRRKFSQLSKRTKPDKPAMNSPSSEDSLWLQIRNEPRPDNEAVSFKSKTDISISEVEAEKNTADGPEYNNTPRNDINEHVHDRENFKGHLSTTKQINPGIKENVKFNAIRMKESATNKATRVLFLISLIYMVSWSVGCASALTNYQLGMIVGEFGYILVALNCVTNPWLYISMSSKFKANALKILCKR